MVVGLITMIHYKKVVLKENVGVMCMLCGKGGAGRNPPYNCECGGKQCVIPYELFGDPLGLCVRVDKHPLWDFIQVQDFKERRDV